MDKAGALLLHGEQNRAPAYAAGGEQQSRAPGAAWKAIVVIEYTYTSF